MKFKRGFWARALFLLSATAISQASWAAGTPAPTASASPEPSASPSPIEVTPDLLRTQMLRGDYSIAVGLNTLYQAKISLAQARASLFLPGAKIGALFNPTSSPASFALNSVSVLLPFLVPSNWFAEKASAHMLDAEKSAYYILELNEYASAYSMYATIVNDIDVEQALQENYNALAQVASILQGRANSFQPVDPNDLKNAIQAAEQAEGQLSKMHETVQQEKAAMTVILGLPLADLRFSNPVHIAESAFESESAEQILTQGLKVSPEASQINALVDSQNDQKWSDVFAFVNSVSLSNTSGNSGTGSGTSSNTGTSLGGGFAFEGNADFGLASFPTYLLDKEKVAAVALQLKNLTLTEASEIQSSLASISGAKDQITDYAAAEANAVQVLNSEGNQYFLGQTDLLNVFQAVSAVVTARMSRIQSQADLDTQRINLNRILLSDEFAELPTCQLNSKARATDSGPFGWIKDIFHPSTNEKTIDQMCQVIH
jgi:multidrug efflux system outer membrane protein